MRMLTLATLYFVFPVAIFVLSAMLLMGLLHGWPTTVILTMCSSLVVLSLSFAATLYRLHHPVEASTVTLTAAESNVRVAIFWLLVVAVPGALAFFVLRHGSR